MITINDVAIKSGFSKSTVSKVLNHKEITRIPKATKEKIINTANELGYKPSMVAKSLAHGKTYTIGVIVPILSDGNIVNNAETICKEYGYNIIVSCSRFNKEEEDNAVQMLLDRRVDGVLTVPISANNLVFDDSNYQNLEKNNIPVVILEQPVNNTNIPIVVEDQFKASYDVTSYLISKKIKNISFCMIAGLDFDFVIEERKQGFIKALKDNNLYSGDKNIIYIDHQNQDSNFDISDLIKKNNIEGIVAHCDSVAIRITKQLLKQNISVPNDLLVASFDDLLVASYFTPSITSIRHSASEMVGKAISILIGRMDNMDSNRNKIFKCNPQLIIKESTERI